MSSYFFENIRKKIIVLACIIFTNAIVLSLHKPTQADTGIYEGKIIEEKCARCHSPDRTNFLKKDKEGWDITLKRMREKDTSWLSEEDVIACAAFLNSQRAISGESLFKKLCLSCHSEKGREKLLYQAKAKEAWVRAIERMRRKFNFLIGIAEASEIAKFWTAPENNKNLKLKSEPIDILEGVFEEKCGRCHTHNFFYSKKKKENDWLNLLNRMRSKSPQWINRQNLEQIKEYIFQNKKFLIKGFFSDGKAI